MENSKDEPQTPRFGYCEDNAILSKEQSVKRVQTSSKAISKYLKNKEKNKSRNKETSKITEKSEEKRKEKNKNKSKEKSKNKSSKSNKKIISSTSLPTEHKYVNPLDAFLKKKLELRNDFDQENSEKFLLEKELAFQKFRINEDADFIDN